MYRCLENHIFSPTKTQVDVYLLQAMKYTLHSEDLCKSDEHSLRGTLRRIVYSCDLHHNHTYAITTVTFFTCNR